ncbi:LOW QUALITY PROTEIN: SR-related and CTD-associated factor 8 [Gastrophryne carolinensis]
MEAVKTFNNEGQHQGIEVPYRSSQLYSLNDYRPPISKAKMTQITKSAIKAIKFYKHVVQSVEKFIQKCKPEYKVPGLYVIDSIVRQSRHQFGQEKDLFAPRFSNNIINTFQNLYRCPTDDKSKIVRVLNLWQKNNVFKSEIIQPLLDMAAGIPPPVVTPILPSTTATVINTPGTPVTPVTPANVVQGIPDPWIAQITSADTLAAVAQILQSPQGQQLQQLVQSLHVQQQKPQPSLLQALDAGLVVQLQALTAQLTAAASNSLNPLEQSVSLSKKLIDRFDFVEDNAQNEEPKKESPSVLVASASTNNSLFHQLAEHLQKQNFEHLRHQFLEQQHTPKVAVQENQEAMSESENSATPSQDDIRLAFLEKEESLHNSINMQEDMDIEDMQDSAEELFANDEKIVKVEIPRACSKSRSRSPRKRRSRSRSGSRRRKHRKRSRTRSRERKRKNSRSYSSERRAREREKERQKKGLPPIRSKALSVCSTTLWVGQVDKKATQQDLTNVFEEFGQIESINMIPPRGCAYVCMVHRQDAYRALQKLSAGSCKIGSKIIKIAWALNKGVKTEYKQFWDVDLGVTYVPWEKVKLDDLDGFAEGGMIDQETVNNDWSKQRNTEATAVKEPHAVAAPVPTTTVPSPIVPKSTITAAQTESYPQPVAMLQIPVTPSVPALSLVPPAFPVSMSVPPPGFSTLPPPPFMRAGFNPSQPPPGFIPPHGPPPNITPIGTAIPTALVPRLPISVDGMKEISYSSLMLPVGSVVTTSATTSSVFAPSSETEQGDKRRHSTEKTEMSASNTFQSTVVSSPGIFSLQSQPPITAPVRHLSLPGRMTGMPFLDIRPGLLSQSATARFSLITPTLQPPPRSMLPAPLIDSAVHSLPFPTGDIFPHPIIPPRLNSGNIPAPDENVPLPTGNIQQEGDQDYRFPPVESIGIPSGNEHKKETMSVDNKESKLVTPVEEIDFKSRHIQDDHEPQDMAVVDFEGQEKPPESSMSVESSHKAESKIEAQFSDARESDHLTYESKFWNIPESRDNKIQQPLEVRQQFGSSRFDLLPPFVRNPLEIREMFGRLPPDTPDPFGRITESHFSRQPVERKEQYGRPLLEGRNIFGLSTVDGGEHFGRPPLDLRDHFGKVIADGGRQVQFHPNKPWGHRGDFDERPLTFTGFGGSKGFQDERPLRGNYRPEVSNAMGWNRGLDSDSRRDFDDCHPWERNRDRDDRALAFRREINGNRFGREMQYNNWIPPQTPSLDFPEAIVANKKEDIPQVNGDIPEASSQPQTIDSVNKPELCEQGSSDNVNKEKDGKNAEVESQPVVESTETEGT